MFKKYLKSYGFLLGIIIALTLILSIFNYFIPFKANIIKIIIPIMAIFISAIILGKGMKEKAYLEGIKFAIIFIGLLSIVKLILKDSFNYKTIIMYIALSIASILGAMLGINLKKE